MFQQKNPCPLGARKIFEASDAVASRFFLQRKSKTLEKNDEAK